MAQEAILRNEFVSAGDIKPDDLRCPRESCRSNTLVLHGTSQVTRVETLEAGVVTSTRLDEASHAFEIEVIECLACGTRWHIKTREVVALEERNEELRQMVIEATGADPYGITGKAN
jgi:hypothetical protein